MVSALSMVKSRNARAWLLFFAIVFVAGIAYAWLLNFQESQLKARLAELRLSNPNLYLAEIRSVVHFDKYLAEYRVLEGYEKFRGAVPAFLLGRWALFTKAKRVSDFYFASNCTNSVAFEDGLVKTIGEVVSTHAVEYKLDGNVVTMRLVSGGEGKVKLVSYGEQLHHIELTMPGYKGVRYGYLCK